MKTQSPPEVVIQLRADPERFSDVRRTVATHLGAWGHLALVDAAQLCVTEILANVHRHVAVPECEVRLRVLPEAEGGAVQVSVADRSPVLPVLCTEPDWGAESGRGMFLIAAAADLWGTMPTRDGKLVWARLAGKRCEQRVIEDAVRTGTVDPDNAATACGLGDWQPLPARPEAPAELSEVLRQMRGEEER
ncbi:ATP-binding protein [Streptomyces sp. NPDC102340]|uniref:ATP-binding protein n=1 Tax=unclassified Streptomyces TaxID=2593676 RepID=UPI003807F830